MIQELSYILSRGSDDPLGILVLAGLAREDFPWLYEIGLEAYRIAKGTNIDKAHQALVRFRDAALFTVREIYGEEIAGSKELRWAQELPDMIHREMEMFLEGRRNKRGSRGKLRSKSEIIES